MDTLQEYRIQNIKAVHITVFLIILIGLSSSSEIQYKNLSQFIEHHRSQYELIPMPGNRLKNQEKIIFPIYLFSSILYTQICYPFYLDNKENAEKNLPSMLIKRSYSPLNSASIMCYQIYDKLLLTQQPSFISPQQSNLQDDKKSNKKQISYLQAEYQLLRWLYRLGTEINKKLQTDKLSLTKINKFSLLISLNQSDEPYIQILQIWRSEDHEQRSIQPNRLQKKLSGKGFHQTARYNLKIKSKSSEMDINSEQCLIQMIQTLPHSTYIDIDELKGYGYGLQTNHADNKNGQSYIDIEKPAYLSQQYQYRLRIPLKYWESTGVDEYQIKIPVHYRYPSPYLLQSYNSKNSQVKTSGSSNHQYPNSNRINKASEIIDFVEVSMYPTTKCKIICYSESLQKLGSRNEQMWNQTKVYPLEEEYLNDSGTANIPVGDGILKSIVNAVTLGSEVVCAVLLVKMLRK